MRDIGEKAVKTVDRSTDLGERMKKALVRTADQAQNLTDNGQVTPSEYAGDKLQYGMEDIATAAGHIVVSTGKGAYRTGKSALQKEQQTKGSSRRRNSSINVLQKTEKTIKQSTRTTEQSAKTLDRSVKGTQKAVKTAEQSSKVAIKTAQETAKAAQNSAQAVAKTAEKAVQIAWATARAAAAAAKAAAKACVAAVKAIVAAVKELVALIAAGGWVAVIIIIVTMLVALIVGSCFGVFFSSEDTGSPMTMKSVILEINMDYQASIDTILNTTAYDQVEISGSSAAWSEVLAIYAVKVNTDPNNPQDVASMDAAKKAVLKEIFWEMNQIDYWVEAVSDTVLAQGFDEAGNTIIIETTEITTTLYISTTHQSATTTAYSYNFTDEQYKMLNELLQDENKSIWDSVLQGIKLTNKQRHHIELSFKDS